MIHLIAGPVIGAVLYHLYQKHKSHGVDKCSKCEQLGQIGPLLRYVPTTVADGVTVETPFCKKCRPEIFP